MVREPLARRQRPIGMVTSYHGTGRALAGLFIACGIGLAACGSGGDAPAAGTAGPDSTSAVSAASVETGPGTTSSSPPSSSPQVTGQGPAPVEIVGVYEGVNAYPACGNEPLQHDGVTWYPVMQFGYRPFDSGLQARADQILTVERVDPPGAVVQGFVRRVPSPGPGDDIGTLVVWADGVARWISDSGKLDVWMIDDEISYSWVC